jgi:hypothetical protein
MVVGHERHEVKRDGGGIRRRPSPVLGSPLIEEQRDRNSPIGYSTGSILCRVPHSLVQKTQAGIDTTPVDCILWRERSSLPRLPDV